MVTRPLARAQVMRSRTCTDLIQPCSPYIETILYACTESSHGKIGKAEPWTWYILISYWSDDKLSSSLDYFTLDCHKL